MSDVANSVGVRAGSGGGAIRPDEGSSGGGTPMTHQQAEVAPLLEKFRNVVWACFECSAKIHHCIDEVRGEGVRGEG